MMHKIKEMLYRELEEYANVERLSGGSLEMIHKITDTIKNIDKIEMLEGEGGSSYGGDWMARGTYDRMGDHSQRNRKRDSMGRFSGEGNRQVGTYNDGSYRGGSSYGGEEGVHELLEEAMEMATNERERSAIRRAIEEIRK